MSGLERSALARMSTAQFRDAREEARADESADAVSIDEEEARSKATLRTLHQVMVLLQTTVMSCVLSFV